MQKLYCYVDETWQDTEGRFFLVSVVITNLQREKLRDKLKRIEKMSGRGSRKWTKSTPAQRKKYIEAVITDKSFADNIFYATYHDTRAYTDLIISTTAKALLEKAKLPYEATIFVDGLERSKRRRFAAGLRDYGVKVRKVRGIRDQSDEFIRLADAIAGFVRNNLEGNETMRSLYKKAEQNKIIRKIL